MPDPTTAVGKGFADFVREALHQVREITADALAQRLSGGAAPLLLDVRGASEFAAARLPGAINVPRGVLETAGDWGFDTTVPALAGARPRAIVVISSLGDRSALAAQSLQRMGFADVASLRRGLRAWSESGLPLVDGAGRALDSGTAQRLLAARIRPERSRIGV